jgi:hypothetical protein
VGFTLTFSPKWGCDTIQHMTSKRDWFQEYKQMTISFIIYMGDDIESHMAGVGIILIQLSTN